MQRHFDLTVPGAAPGPVERTEVYRRLDFPAGAETPLPRPYTAINMVATVDGKVVVGGPGTTRLIGSETDHYLMARIEAQADAVLLGAGLLRADDPPYPRLSDESRRRREALGLRPDPLWAVVSGSGQLTPPAMAAPGAADGPGAHAPAGTTPDRPVLPRLFRGPLANTALFTTERMVPQDRERMAAHTQVFICGEQTVDPRQMATILRQQLGVRRMICLGGPILNASMIETGLADEVFITLAPKLQGGSRLPTAIEGVGYAATALPVLELLSLYSDGSELYLRYRLPPDTTSTTSLPNGP
ncbi:MAG TPA: dihydrofolate reductase family protein [Chloroflexota bacterium]|nr:dihydrofolate reductase family protein [Chloroflexota bacterium]